jgi:hypothetical protein
MMDGVRRGPHNAVWHHGEEKEEEEDKNQTLIGPVGHISVLYSYDGPLDRNASGF